MKVIRFQLNGAIETAVTYNQEVWAACEPVCRTGVCYRNGNCGGAEKDRRANQGQGIREHQRSLKLKASRVPLKLDEYGSPIQNYYIRKVQMIDGQRQNVVAHTCGSVSQFRIWNPQEFMAMPSCADMKGN